MKFGEEVSIFMNSEKKKKAGPNAQYFFQLHPFPYKVSRMGHSYLLRSMKPTMAQLALKSVLFPTIPTRFSYQHKPLEVKIPSVSDTSMI